MRARWSVATIPFCLLSLAACDTSSSDEQPEQQTPDIKAPPDQVTPPAATLPVAEPAPVVDEGAVFTISNADDANEVLSFRRAADGSLTPAGVFPTGGRGTGKGLGSQGALALSPDGKSLVVVDAGTNQISSFSVQGASLVFRSRVSSGGTMPISIAIYGGLVYALNAGEPSNISGFRLDAAGALAPIASSTRMLSVSAAGPAQVSFAPKGGALVVTEKATNTIDTFVVQEDGTPSEGEMALSAGKTPFGFAFTPTGQIIVSEAFGAAAGAGAVSSYGFDKLLHAGARGGAEQGIKAISSSIANTQTAPCWVVVSPDGKIAYTANTPSGTLSAYAINEKSELTLIGDGAAGVTGDGSKPLDMTLDRGGKRLYVLNSGTRRIKGFDVAADGSLTGRPMTFEVPASAFGLIGF